MVMMATAMGVSAQQAADPATMDQSALDAMMSVINGVPRLQWSIVKRGFWVNGVDNLRDFLVTTLRYTLADVGKNIACPTLVMAGEHDSLRACVEPAWRALPNGQMCILPGAGTYVCERQTEAVAALLREFFMFSSP